MVAVVVETADVVAGCESDGKVCDDQATGKCLSSEVALADAHVNAHHLQRKIILTSVGCFEWTKQRAAPQTCKYS